MLRIVGSGKFFHAMGSRSARIRNGESRRRPTGATDRVSNDKFDCKSHANELQWHCAVSVHSDDTRAPLRHATTGRI